MTFNNEETAEQQILASKLEQIGFIKLSKSSIGERLDDSFG